MVLSSMISKSSASVLPPALRAISRAGSLQYGLIIAANNMATAVGANRGLKQPTLIINGSRQFSEAPNAKKIIDNSLLKALRSEIRAAKKFDQDFPNTPSSFPFTIKDNSGEDFITLTRELKDESIEIEVRHPEALETIPEEDDISSSDDDSDADNNKDKNEEQSTDDSNSSDDSSNSDDTSDSEEDDGDDNNEEEKELGSSCLPMTMTIRRDDGRSLEVELTAFLHEIKVESLLLSEFPDSDNKVELTAPRFEELDEDLQHCFLKYLEIRGIKTNYFEFLHGYMVAKSRKDDLLLMKRLKHFVKN